MRFIATIALFATAATAESVWDGVYTKDQARRGQSFYNQHCASCHGDTMSGGESAPPLAGIEFLANWNGLTAGDLFERIRTTMPVGRVGKLTRETNSDIIAYMLSFNEFPAGGKELGRAAEALKSIKVEMTRPEKK